MKPQPTQEVEDTEADELEAPVLSAEALQEAAKEAQKEEKNLPKDFFKALRLILASPEGIIRMSHGEVTKAETINYRTFKAEKDGLFDERIFGPTKDYECYCGKYRRIRYKGIVCDRCGVEVTSSSVRRDRMGHVVLAAPVAHIWFFKSTSSPLAQVLGISSSGLERIVYFALYLIKQVHTDKRPKAEQRVAERLKESIDMLQKWYVNEQEILKKLEEKETTSLKKKVSNTDQQHIAGSEIEHKYKQRKIALSKDFGEKKAIQENYYDKLTKLVHTIKPMNVLEEDDYLAMRDMEIDDLVEVGMGAEVILEVLSSTDFIKLIAALNKKLEKAKGERRTKILKRIRVIESFMKQKIDPKSMVLTVLPVLPPDLRPMVQLTGGKFATSDLNDFYRRVINRNNRLKHLIELGAPNIILRNEKRMLQESVDSLIDLTKSTGRASTGSRSVGTKKKKSLSDILKGKQGRFRQNLLGKRVDYSGRSVIVVGPELHLNQCGLPKEMALELFKPFILKEIIMQGYATNIKSAKNFFEEKNSTVYEILEKVTKDYPILLNRAPTLHKLGILAFYPVLTDDIAIRLHPCVCAGFNADFDGDAMGVFVPLSEEAKREAIEYMLPSRNVLKPADGSLIAVPNKEMVLGLYFLTSIDQARFKAELEKPKHYCASSQEALMAYDHGVIDVREPLGVLYEGKMLITTVGRLMLNAKLPEGVPFVNHEMKLKDVKDLVKQSYEVLDGSGVATLVDSLKSLGFWAATQFGGASFSVLDAVIHGNKDKIVSEAEGQAAEIEGNYAQGLLTRGEKQELSINLWIETTEKLADLTWDDYEEENPVKIIIKSGGARASREQLKQISGIKGLVYDPMGKIVEMPTKSNYREGLTIFEYFTSTRGARKGLADSALKTADAGYLTRRLVDVAHDMIIKEDDCGTEEGIEIETKGIRGGKFTERIVGRFAAADIKKGNTILVKRNELITEEAAQKIVSEGITKILMRSPLVCRTTRGVCVRCYGMDLGRNRVVEFGVPVGVVAAQSVGEPGTQLTMRVRHFGGIVISDVTQGLPRVEELFETRTPKVISPIAELDGKVQVKEDAEHDAYLVRITSTNSDDSREYLIPLSQKLHVKDGQLVGRGTQLSEGYLRLKEVLEIKGMRAAQVYLLNEVQAVYESQGIGINDKHFEVLIRKMSDKIIVEDEGDSNFLVGELVNKDQFVEENKRLVAKGGKPATGKATIMGVTRAAVQTDSWLSAASFQNTTTVLTNAAIRGKVDYLYGLKENVIIGRLIPVTQDLLEKYYV